MCPQWHGHVSAEAQSDAAELGIATSGRALGHSLLSPRRVGTDAGSSASLPSFFVTTGICHPLLAFKGSCMHVAHDKMTHACMHIKTFLIKKKNLRVLETRCESCSLKLLPPTS